MHKSNKGLQCTLLPHSLSTVRIVRNPPHHSLVGDQMGLHTDDKVHVQGLLPLTSAILHTRAAHLAGVNSNNYLQSHILSLVLIQLLNYFLYSSNSYSADKKIIATNKVNIAELLTLFSSSLKTCRKLILNTLSKQKGGRSSGFSLIFYSYTKYKIDLHSLLKSTIPQLPLYILILAG